MLSLSPRPSEIFGEMQKLMAHLPVPENKQDYYLCAEFDTQSFGKIKLAHDVRYGRLSLENDDGGILIRFEQNGACDTTSERILRKVGKIINDINSYLTEKGNSAQVSLPTLINNIPVCEITFKDINEYDPDRSAFAVLKKELIRIGLYSHDYLYTVFPEERLDLVLKTGAYIFDKMGREQPVVYANKVMFNSESGQEEIRHNDDHGHIFTYLDSLESAAERYFAVFDSKAFIYNHSGYYEYKDPDDKLSALIAVVKIKDCDTYLTY